MSRVLLVEDNPQNLELMRYLLVAHGHEVRTASDGSEAASLLEAERPDLIVCDIQMPVMNGFELLRWVRGNIRLRGVPVIAVTALAMVGDRESILAAGFDGYLAKPIDPENFVRNVLGILGDAFSSPVPAEGGRT